MTPETKATITATVVAIALLLTGALCFALVGCNADWNKPHPVLPEPGNPCGLRWHSCGLREDGKHGCCYETDSCRPGGYCAFVGDNFGAARDGGRESMSRQLSPEEAHELERRR